MVAAVLDRNTGLPTTLGGLAANIGFSQTQETPGSTTSGSSTGTDKATSAVVNATNQVNTTPGALAALEKLITTLTDRPAISDAQAQAKFPDAVRTFSPSSGWYYVTPGGTSMTQEQAKQYNTQQAAKRQQLQQAAGTIAGGTSAQQAQQANRQQEITTDRATRAGYSKEAAATDAQALIDKSIRDALEAALPQITAGLEGAGTSKSTIAASLTQKAATKGGIEGAALGANLASSYGQISNQLSGVLELLTRSDPNSPEAMLLQAIIGSKGLINAGVSTQSGTTTDNKGAASTQTKEGDTVNTTRLPITPGMVGTGVTPIAVGAGYQAPLNALDIGPGGSASGAYPSGGATGQPNSLVTNDYLSIFNSGTDTTGYFDS